MQRFLGGAGVTQGLDLLGIPYEIPVVGLSGESLQGQGIPLVRWILWGPFGGIALGDLPRGSLGPWVTLGRSVGAPCSDPRGIP